MPNSTTPTPPPMDVREMGLRIGNMMFPAEAADTPAPPQMLPGDYQMWNGHIRMMKEDTTLGEWVDLSKNRGRIEYAPPVGRPVQQPWVLNISLMQQSVLMGIVRGPDGVEKYHPVKPILRWYRRCLLLSALDGEIITDPYDGRGGSFTGPSLDFDPKKVQGDRFAGFAWEAPMTLKFDDFMRTMDQMPIHFFLHMMHAVEIMGYHHSDPRIALWWNKCYIRMVEAMHVYPESKEQLDSRLGDTREGWLARSDPAITK